MPCSSCTSDNNDCQLETCNGCLLGMINAQPAFTANLVYDEVTSTTTQIPITDIFVFSLTDCSLNDCNLINAADTQAYSNPNSISVSQTLGITVKNTVAAGYTESFRLNCVQNSAQGNHQVISNVLTLTQSSCLQSVVALNYPNQVLQYQDTLSIDVTNFFKNNSPVGCPIQNCYLKQGQTCALNDANESRVTVGTSSPFVLSFTGSIKEGVIISTCYICEISIGSISHVISQAWQLQQNPFDCTGKIQLSDTILADQVVPYNPAFTNQAMLNFGAGYSSFFKTLDSIACAISSCTLFQNDCLTAPTWTELVMSSVYPWQLKAQTDVGLGYAYNACIKCQTNDAKSLTHKWMLTQVYDCQAYQSQTSQNSFVYNYNEIEPQFVLNQGYKSFMTNDDTKCQKDICTFFQTGCILPLTLPTGVQIGFDEYEQILLSQNLIYGYQFQACIKCEFTNVALPAQKTSFQVDNLSFIQNPVCLNALSKIQSVPAIAKIPYVENLGQVVVIQSYDQLILNNNPNSCPIESCQLKQPGNCEDDYVPKNIRINQVTPFSILATQNVIQGYSESFCYQCKIKDNISRLNFNNFTVEQEKSQSTCLGQLVLRDPINLAYEFQYQENQTQLIQISSGYYHYFYTHQLIDCPINSCQLLESSCINNYTSSQNVQMEKESPWRLYARLNQSEGYHASVCFKCSSVNNETIKTIITISQLAYQHPILLNFTDLKNETINSTFRQNITFIPVKEIEKLTKIQKELILDNSIENKLDKISPDLGNQVILEKQQNKQVNNFFDNWWLEKLNQDVTKFNNKKKENPVELEIKNISRKGLVTIKFNQDLLVPIFIQEAQKRSLQEFNFTLDQIDVEKNIMKIAVVLKSDRDQKLNYTTELKSWSEKYMKIQLNFSQPLLVSAGIKPDVLVINVVNPYLFTSKQTGDWLQEENQIIDKTIVKQYQNDFDPSTMDLAAELVDNVVKSVTIIQLIAQLLLKGSIEEIISLYYTLQIICYTENIYNIQIPSSTQGHLQILRNLIEFSVLKPEPLIQLFKEDFTLKSLFNDQKKNNNNSEREDFFQQMQLYILIAVIVLIITILLIIIGYWKRELVKMLYQKVISIMIFNGIIRSYQLSYAKFLVNQTENILNNNQLALAVAMMFLTLSGAIYITIFLAKNSHMVDSKKWGNLVKDVQIIEYSNIWNMNHYSWLYLPFFMLRRFIFVLVPLLISHQAFQLMLLIQISIASLYSYVHSKPHTTYRRYIIEIMNELLILCYSYHLICFTDFNKSLDEKFEMGISNSMFLAFLIIQNLVNMVLSLTSSWRRNKRINDRKKLLQASRENNSKKQPSELEPKLIEIKVSSISDCESEDSKSEEKKRLDLKDKEKEENFSNMDGKGKNIAEHQVIQESNQPILHKQKKKHKLFQPKKVGISVKQSARQEQIKSVYIDSKHNSVNALAQKIQHKKKYSSPILKKMNRNVAEKVRKFNNRELSSNLSKDNLDYLNIQQIQTPRFQKNFTNRLIDVKRNIDQKPDQETFRNSANNIQNEILQQKVIIPQQKNKDQEQRVEIEENFMKVGDQDLVIDKRQVKKREDKNQLMKEIEDLKMQQRDENVYDSEHIQQLRRTIILILEEQLQKL